MFSVLTFSTVIFHAKLSMALLSFLPFKPSFVPRLWSSSWNSIPKNTDCYITHCTIDFAYKMFSLAAGNSYNLFLCFSPFPVTTPSCRPSSRIKRSRAILWLCFHVVCNSPFQCWGSHTGTRLVPTQTLLQRASACSLHCWQYCDKRQSLVTLLE